MNKTNILNALNEIANELDSAGMVKESQSVTNVMKRVAQMPQVAPISRPGQTYGYESAVEKWINTNQTAVNNALQSPMPMQALAPLLMNVKPVELANAIRTKIGQMQKGLA